MLKVLQKKTEFLGNRTQTCDPNAYLAESKLPGRAFKQRGRGYRSIDIKMTVCSLQLKTDKVWIQENKVIITELPATEC